MYRLSAPYSAICNTKEQWLIINGAVIDEMSKQLIVTGQTDRQELAKELVMTERGVENSAKVSCDQGYRV
jgi:hypothetical protein